MMVAIARAHRHGWRVWRAGPGWVCMVLAGGYGGLLAITVYADGTVEA